VARLEPISHGIYESLAAKFGEATFGNREEWLIAHWRSRNPQVHEDLVLDTETYPSLYWFKGYMWDFTGDEKSLAMDVVSFLNDFFEERVVCGVQWAEGQVKGGGPIDLRSLDEDGWWNDKDVLIRSWRGTYDRG